MDKRLEKLGIRLDDTQRHQFDTFYKLLIEWNQVMNLTAITEYQEVMEKHFLDSLAIVKAIDMSTVERVIDVGTGAGFPGIPLKLAFPHIKVTLLDSLNKRIRFLDAVIDKLGLEDAEAIHGRAEDYAKTPQYREQYDLCVSRAVANLSTLSEYCLPYIREGGIFVSYKSGDVEEEICRSHHALELLGGQTREVVKFQLPDTDIARSFVVIEKKKKTPGKYPRKAGLPTKEPL